ncbi:MAG: hypothetical protein E7458_08155 [Ruminococcaceae bacterium]|nr:hypothetical protein [Oscillospiraceae bacterium]
MAQNHSAENRLSSPFRKLITGNLSIQMMVTVLAAIVYAILAYFWDAGMGGLITSVIFIPTYFSMLYSFYWGTAERERNMVLYGHMKEDPARGLRSGMYAALPIGVFSLLTAVLALLGRGGNVIGIYRICAAPFIGFVNPLIEYFPLGILIVAVFSPLAAMWGYHNGSRLYRMWDHLIYKDGVKKRRSGRGTKDEPRCR